MLKKIILVIVLIIPLSLHSKTLNHLSSKVDGTIQGAIDVSISADDKFVYVAGFGNGKYDLVTFKRNMENGSLEVIQTRPDSFSLNRTYELLLSKDQDNIYVLAEDDDEISVLSRNNETGMLTEIQNLRTKDLPAAGIANTTVLAESNDEQYILASGREVSISVFRRAAGTGELEFVHLWENDSNIPMGYEIFDIEFMPGSDRFYVSSPTGITAFKLNVSNGEITYLWTENGYNNEALSTIKRSFEIAVNKDNKDVYLASKSGLHVFASDSESGQLSLKQFIEIEALNHTMVIPRKLNVTNGMLYMVVGEDGNFGYFEQNGLFQFSIDSENGKLVTVDSIFNGTDLELMHGPTDIVFSSDNKSAYVPVFVSGVLLQFDSNPVSGELTYQSYTNAANGVRGLTSPRDVKVSADGNYLYFTDGFQGVASFEFNPQDESLNFIESVTPYPQYAGGFSTGTLSPDGKHFYLVERINNKIHLFDRAAVSGKLTFSQTFSSGVEWIEEFRDPSSLEISANGEYAYITHSNSNWLVTILARNPENGALTLVERIQNNIYGNTNGIGKFVGAVNSRILPEGNHLLVYSNSGQLALLGIEELTGKLELLQLMENGLFGVPNSRITTEDIGLNGNYLYFPYRTSNDSSWEVDDGIIVSELNFSSNNLIVKHKYSSLNESYDWLEGEFEFKLNSAGNKAYITKDYGELFVTVIIDDATGAISLFKKVTPEELGLPDLGSPILKETFQNDKYIVSIDGFNGKIDLFRKNTGPEFAGAIQNYKVNVGEYLKIDFTTLFLDVDNDSLVFEIQGAVPEWLKVDSSFVEGTPSSTDSGTTLKVKVSDGIDDVTVDITIDVVLEVVNTPIDTSSGGGAVIWFSLLVAFMLVARRK